MVQQTNGDGLVKPEGVSPDASPISVLDSLTELGGRQVLSEAEISDIKNFLIQHQINTLDPTPSFHNLRVWSNCYYKLLSSLFHPSGISTYKTTTSDALSIWCLRTNQLCLKHPTFKALSELISTESLDELFEFVGEFWNDSGASLSNAIRDMFTKFTLLIPNLFSPHISSTIFRRWLSSASSNLPSLRRSPYLMMDILIRNLGAHESIDICPGLISESLPLMDGASTSGPISRMVLTILRSYRNELLQDPKQCANADSQWLSIWSGPVKSALGNSGGRRNVQVHILPHLADISAPAYLKFLDTLVDPQTASSASEDNLEIMVAVLKIAQDKGLLPPSYFESAGAVFLKGLLHNESRSLRLSGFALAACSNKTSKPLPLVNMNLLKQSLDEFFVDPDAEFRNSTLSLMRRLLSRLRESSYALHRNITPTKKKKLPSPEEVAEASKELAISKDFCCWLIEFIKNQLRPGVSYQRLQSALRFFPYLARSGLDKNIDPKNLDLSDVSFPFHVGVFDKVMVHLLVENLVNNTFDDIRLMCQYALSLAPTHILSESLPHVDEMISEGFTYALSPKGRMADGGARLLCLCSYIRIATCDGGLYEDILQRIESGVLYAQTHNLSDIASSKPFHGLLTALQLILPLETKCYPEANWQVLIKRTINLCSDIWDITEQVLAHDSPEGNVPEELSFEAIQELERLYGPATQLVSSFSWRAIKETSSVLEIICRLSAEHADYLIPELLGEIGNLLFKELSVIRHRGALSSVYPALISCCQCCKNSLDPDLKRKPEEWLNANLELLQSKAQMITRRSGGLPSLITALLCSETNKSGSTLIKTTLDRLLAIAAVPVELQHGIDKISLPQVHAMNCMRAIFTESRLSEVSAPYADRVLALTLQLFSSDIWAIRNCAVMLFTALQVLFFGSKRSSAGRIGVGNMSSQVFFSRYKTIMPILEENLAIYAKNEIKRSAIFNVSESHSVESVYPTLSLLSHLENSQGYRKTDPFRPLVIACLTSPFWKIREMATAGLAPLYGDDEIVEIFSQLCGSLNVANQNATHGFLLAMISLVSRISSIWRDQDNTTTHLLLFSELEQKFSLLIEENKCPFTKSAYIRLLRLLIEAFPQTSSSLLFVSDTMWRYVQVTVQDSASSTIRRDYRLILEEICAAGFAIIASCQISGSEQEAFVMHALSSSYYEVQQMALHNIEDRARSLDISFKPVLHRLWDMIRREDWNEVKAPAILLYTHLVILEKSAADQNAHMSELVTIMIDEVASQHATDSMLLACLEAIGPLLALEYGTKSESNWIGKAKYFCRFCDEFGSDGEAYPFRLAILKSISGFLDIMRGLIHLSSTPTTMKDIILDLDIVLLTFLNDDDEDIRQETAQFICINVLQPDTKDQASDGFHYDYYFTETFLAKHLLEIFDMEMASRAWHFLSSGSFNPDERVVNVAVALSESMRPEQHLFSIEKQNLYIDEVDRANRWAKLLLEYLQINKTDQEEVEFIQEMMAQVLGMLDDLNGFLESHLIDKSHLFKDVQQSYEIICRVIICTKVVSGLIQSDILFAAMKKLSNLLNNSDIHPLLLLDLFIED